MLMSCACPRGYSSVVAIVGACFYSRRRTQPVSARQRFLTDRENKKRLTTDVASVTLKPAGACAPRYVITSVKNQPRKNCTAPLPAHARELVWPGEPAQCTCCLHFTSHRERDPVYVTFLPLLVGNRVVHTTRSSILRLPKFPERGPLLSRENQFENTCFPAACRMSFAFASSLGLSFPSPPPLAAYLVH